jgi:hypothetical protein
MMERDREIGNTMAKIKELQRKIDELEMQRLYFKDANKWTDSDVGDRSTGGHGRAGHGDCAELGAHGYEVEPQDIVDENGYGPFIKVRRPLSTYATR